MPCGETFFAHRFGQFRDKFGTSWMVIHEKPMGPPCLNELSRDFWKARQRQGRYSFRMKNLFDGARVHE